MMSYHYAGEFQCAENGCHFQSHYRFEVTQHYNKIHKAHQFICEFDGCGKTFSCRNHLNNHLNMHRGILPYRCTWPACRFSSNRSETVVRHVRMVHFKLPASQREQKERNIKDERDPKQFLEVLTELL